MKLIVNNTEKQTQIDNLKIQFDDKNSTLKTDYRVLQAVKAEYDKTDLIITALNGELEEKLAKASHQYNETSNLGLDEYLSLKQDETTIKNKIEYFIASNEERAQRIEKIEKHLYELRSEVLNIRNAILEIVGREKLNEFIQSHIEELALIRSALFFDLSIVTKTTPSGQRIDVFEAVDSTITNRINRYLKNCPFEVPAALETETISINHTPKSPARQHFEAVTNANQPPKQTGFNRILADIKISNAHMKTNNKE